MISVLDYNEDTKQHTLSVKFRFPLFDDKFDWLKNKDGSFKRDRNGQRIPKIIEGKSHLTNPFTPHYLLNRGRNDLGVGGNFIPHLIFDYVITTHQFNPTPYFTKELTDDRINTQNKIRELHNQGLGYTKIHQYLVKNGFEIGKSRTTVDSIIKKMKKRDEFFSKPILDGIGNFRVKMLEVKK